MHIDWFDTHSHFFNWFIARPAAIIGLIIIGVVLRWALHKMINRLARRVAGGSATGVLRRGKGREFFRESRVAADARREQRAETTASLLKSITTFAIVGIIALMIVGQLGYNIAPLIASAGILGIALGFGAQALVKDFLSGTFMILEDQYGVGDWVDLGEANGRIEAVGLRITRLRDVNGTVWYVRNGEILRVGNMSQNWARTVLDIPVAYTADLDRVRAELLDLAHALWNEDAFAGQVIEEPEVWGVQSLDRDAVLMRLAFKTAPMKQWAIGREMRERIKARFEEVGIEIPNWPSLIPRAGTEGPAHGPAPDSEPDGAGRA